MNQGTGSEPITLTLTSGIFGLRARTIRSLNQYNLGVMYQFGRGVVQDLAEAFRLYELSAQPGYASPQYNLGGMLRSGLGAAQDFVRAASWYWKAAQHNHATAQFNLGVMYERGDGVSADLSRVIFGITEQWKMGMSRRGRL